jgi:hypothetical protein
VSNLISSTELFEAASNSWMLYERFSLNDLHDSQVLHASPDSVILKQFIVLAKILAHVVFPTPLGPLKR